MKRKWHEIEPKDATGLKLPHPEIQGPINEEGDECPWPWEPQQLMGAPLGQYHCGYCGGMNVAGVPHIDWSDDPQVARWRRAKSTPRPEWLAAGVPDEVWWGHLMHGLDYDMSAVNDFDPREHCSKCKTETGGQLP